MWRTASEAKITAAGATARRISRPRTLPGCSSARGAPGETGRTLVHPFDLAGTIAAGHGRTAGCPRTCRTWMSSSFRSGAAKTISGIATAPPGASLVSSRCSRTTPRRPQAGRPVPDSGVVADGLQRRSPGPSAEDRAGARRSRPRTVEEERERQRLACRALRRAQLPAEPRHGGRRTALERRRSASRRAKPWTASSRAATRRPRLEAMKTDIHPEYVEAHVPCTCGNTFTTRSTKAEIHVEICSNCHPFYTGKQKLVDTGGRVERFQRRAARALAATSLSQSASLPMQRPPASDGALMAQKDAPVGGQAVLEGVMMRGVSRGRRRPQAARSARTGWPGRGRARRDPRPVVPARLVDEAPPRRSAGRSSAASSRWPSR